jgi:hypothetical protein
MGWAGAPHTHTPLEGAPELDGVKKNTLFLLAELTECKPNYKYVPESKLKNQSMQK